MHRILIQLIMKYFYCLIKNCSLGDFLASGPAMLVTPVPINTLKLSNIGTGQYMDGDRVGLLLPIAWIRLLMYGLPPYFKTKEPPR